MHQAHKGLFARLFAVLKIQGTGALMQPWVHTSPALSGMENVKDAAQRHDSVHASPQLPMKEVWELLCRWRRNGKAASILQVLRAHLLSSSCSCRCSALLRELAASSTAWPSRPLRSSASHLHTVV